MSNPTPFTFGCPSCGQNLSAASEHIGQTIECPACHNPISVPQPLTLAAAAPQPVRVSGQAHHYAGAETRPAAPKGLVLAAWLLIGVTCLAAMVPGLGFVVWLIVAPVLLVTFVLGIVALNKGATTQGIMILLCSLIAAPVFVFVAPFVSTALALGGAAATGAASEASSRADNRSPNPADGERSAAPASYRQGETVLFDDSSWVVLSATELGTILPDQGLFKERSTEGRFILVRFKVTNLTREEEAVMFTPAVRDSKGRRYEEFDESEFYLPDGDTGMTIEPLPADLPKTFASIFEVPRDSRDLVFLARSLGFDKKEKPVELKIEAHKARKRNTGSRTDDDADDEQATRLRPSSEDRQAAREAEIAAREMREKREAKEKLAELKGELAAVNTRIDNERARWQAATNTINRLTNNKRNPVQEGSQAYWQCVEASKVIQEVEAGAKELKEQKARLEGMIAELEK